MAFQRVTPIYDNEAIKTVALQLIDEIRTEAPEILEKFLTITLFQVMEHPFIRNYNELTEAMTFYKEISRGVIYNATIYVNSENRITTTPTDGYSFSQEVYYLVANGATVPNIHNFTCVWLNVLPGNTFTGNYATRVPGIRYFQQILNTSSQNIIVNDEEVVLNENEALLYDPSMKFGINTTEPDTFHIGLVCDNLEKTLEDCINAKPWQLIS